jgi:spermidine/putrescine transport system permease protein
MHMASDSTRAAALLSPAYLWLTVAIFLPLSAMLFFSFLTVAPFTNPDWQLTAANYVEFVRRSLYTSMLIRSLTLSAIVTALCVLIGYPCAYVLARQVKGRAREALFLLIILPFWSNSLVRIFSWAIVLRGNGIIDHTLETLLPIDSNVNLMFTYSAVVIGLVHSYLPYVILTSYLALQAIDEDLLEAARSLGAPFHTILVKLILPLSLPGLAAGAILTFVPVAGSFMEPRILGGKHGTFYGTIIEDQFVAVFNWPLGAALSFILLAFVLVILALAAPVLRRAQ